MRLILAPVLLLAAAPAFAEHNCAFSAQRSVDIDPAGIAALRFELASSDLQVEGVPGLARIEVRARACASQPDWLASLDIVQTRVADKAVVKPTPRPSVVNWTGNNYAFIDFTVRVPAATTLEVDTHSGDADIAHVGALDFNSHSGDLKLRGVTGLTTVHVGSGDVVAEEVGSLVVRGAGSGDVTATDVRGDVKVGSVGSGDVHFSRVQGGLQIESIGSGDLAADDIGQDVVVGSIGSGDIDAHAIRGSLIVRAAGSGEIRHRDVGGQVQVPKRHEND